MTIEHPAEAGEALHGFDAQFWAMHKASREEPPAWLRSARRSCGLCATRSRGDGQIDDAICRDYGWRSHDETLMAEIVPALTIVSDALGNVAAGCARSGAASRCSSGPAATGSSGSPRASC